MGGGRPEKKPCTALGGRRTMRGTPGREPHIPYQIPNIPSTKYGIVCPFKRNMLTAEGQHFICPLNMGYIPYQRVILAFRGIFLPEKRVLQDMICCPSAVNKCPFKRTYYFIFGKECLVFDHIICCPFRMYCLAPYTVILGPTWRRGGKQALQTRGQV